MSGLALVSWEHGVNVTGSDLKQSRYMRSLLRAGVPVSTGHDAAHINDGIDIVVTSSAVPGNNPEYLAAQQLGLEIWPRARMLAYICEGHQTLAVAGTHGKTTTSAMLATALDRLGTDPTFLIGGVVDGYDSTAKAGKGEQIVVEADESDGSFTWLNPDIAIITNIETDHLDHYSGLDEIYQSFASFLGKLSDGGTVIVNDDDPELVRLAKASGRRVVGYGLGDGGVLDEAAVASEMPSSSTSPAVLDSPVPDTHLCCLPNDSRGFDVLFPDGRRYSLTLPGSPGVHNMLNATAVLALLDALGFDREAAAAAICGFSGVRRRFDRIGEAGGVAVIDDYGHHPTEIAATLKAASELGWRRLHVLFQPHRYTRTQALLPQFATAFEHADSISFMDIYSAGEAPIPGVNSEALVEAVLERQPKAEVRYIHRRAETAAVMAAIAQPGDAIITMGAGDVTTLAPLILQELAAREQGAHSTVPVHNPGTAAARECDDVGI